MASLENCVKSRSLNLSSKGDIFLLTIDSEVVRGRADRDRIRQKHRSFDFHTPLPAVTSAVGDPNPSESRQSRSQILGSNRVNWTVLNGSTQSSIWMSKSMSTRTLSLLLLGVITITFAATWVTKEVVAQEPSQAVTQAEISRAADRGIEFLRQRGQEIGRAHV